MDIETGTPLTTNHTTYQSFNVKVKNTVWQVTFSHGKYNEVRVRKVSNNPFGSIGTGFGTFNEALDHYKSASIKNMLWETKFKFEVQNGVTI